MTICGQKSLVNSGPHGEQAVSLRCRSWRCEYCREHRQAQLAMLARAGAPTTFLTITVNPKVGDSPNDRASKLAWAWRTLVKRIKRYKRLKSLPYLVVIERTKRGEPHLHVLLRAPYIPQPWLSAQMRDLLDSPIVHIRKVDSNEQAARYVTKYLVKDPHQFGTCKRYWRSRDYAPHWNEHVADEVSPTAHWVVVDQPLNEIFIEWEKRGFDITVFTLDRIQWGQPP